MLQKVEASLGTENTKEGRGLVVKFQNGAFALRIAESTGRLCIKDVTQVAWQRTYCGRDWPKQMLKDHIGADAMVSGDTTGLKLRRKKNLRRG